MKNHFSPQSSRAKLEQDNGHLANSQWKLLFDLRLNHCFVLKCKKFTGTRQMYALCLSCLIVFPRTQAWRLVPQDWPAAMRLRGRAWEIRCSGGSGDRNKRKSTNMPGNRLNKLLSTVWPITWHKKCRKLSPWKCFLQSRGFSYLPSTHTSQSLFFHRVVKIEHLTLRAAILVWYVPREVGPKMSPTP